MIETTMFTPEQMRRFQELLINARQMRRLNQTQVADAVGVSQTLISQLERRPSRGMRVDELFRLLAFYNIEPNTVAEILGYTVEKVRIEEDPKALFLLAQLQVVPDEVRENIIRALEWMLRGSRDGG